MISLSLGQTWPNTAYGRPHTCTSTSERPHLFSTSLTCLLKSSQAFWKMSKFSRKLCRYGKRRWCILVREHTCTIRSTESPERMFCVILKLFNLCQCSVRSWHSWSTLLSVIWFCCRCTTDRLEKYLIFRRSITVDTANGSSGMRPHIRERSRCLRLVLCLDLANSIMSRSIRSHSRNDKYFRGQTSASSTSLRQPANEFCDRSRRVNWLKCDNMLVNWTRVEVLQRVRPSWSMILQLGKANAVMLLKASRSWQVTKNTLSSRFSNQMPSSDYKQSRRNSSIIRWE